MTTAKNVAAQTAKKGASAYSEDDVKVLNSDYTGKDNKAEVAAIAEKLGKTIPSVRAKLAAMGLYIKPEPAKKRAGIKKIDLAEVVAAAVADTPENAEVLTLALEKTTSQALQAIIDKFELAAETGE